jgi:hypothetical protein
VLPIIEAASGSSSFASVLNRDNRSQTFFARMFDSDVSSSSGKPKERIKLTRLAQSELDADQGRRSSAQKEEFSNCAVAVPRRPSELAATAAAVRSA